MMLIKLIKAYFITTLH